MTRERLSGRGGSSSSSPVARRFSAADVFNKAIRIFDIFWSKKRRSCRRNREGSREASRGANGVIFMFTHIQKQQQRSSSGILHFPELGRDRVCDYNWLFVAQSQPNVTGVPKLPFGNCGVKVNKNLTADITMVSVIFSGPVLSLCVMLVGTTSRRVTV